MRQYRRYIGVEQHGYWYLDIDGALHKTQCHGMEPEEFFESSWMFLENWYVRCELDWYRMQKEYEELVNTPVDPVYA